MVDKSIVITRNKCAEQYTDCIEDEELEGLSFKQ